MLRCMPKTAVHWLHYRGGKWDMHGVCEIGIVFSYSSVHMCIVARPSGLHTLCAYSWWDHNNFTFNFHLHSTDTHGSYFNYKYCDKHAKTGRHNRGLFKCASVRTVSIWLRTRQLQSGYLRQSRFELGTTKYEDFHRFPLSYTGS